MKKKKNTHNNKTVPEEVVRPFVLFINSSMRTLIRVRAYVFDCLGESLWVQSRVRVCVRARALLTMYECRNVMSPSVCA